MDNKIIRNPKDRNIYLLIDRFGHYKPKKYQKCLLTEFCFKEFEKKSYKNIGQFTLFLDDQKGILERKSSDDTE